MRGEPVYENGSVRARHVLVVVVAALLAACAARPRSGSAGSRRVRPPPPRPVRLGSRSTPRASSRASGSTSGSPSRNVEIPIAEGACSAEPGLTATLAGCHLAGRRASAAARSRSSSPSRSPSTSAATRGGWRPTAASSACRTSTRSSGPTRATPKGDLIAYYFNVAELILPHLRDRPLTMKRMPDGMDGPFFYEKTAPSHTPDWIERCPVESEDAKGGVIGYLMVNDLSTLLYVSEPRLHRDAPAARAARASARRTTYSPTIRPDGRELRGRARWSRSTCTPRSTRSASPGTRRPRARPGCRSTSRSSAVGPTTRCATSSGRSDGRSNRRIPTA